MEYLDTERLAAVAGQATEFHGRQPFPWMNLHGIIEEEGFGRLCAELPDVAMFQREFGRKRGYGQQSHGRYALQYRPALDASLSPAWRDFISELHGEAYEGFLRRLFDLGPRERFVLTMHWHYAPSGASVSPHTDARRKLGSHIFYLNTAEDWDPQWGGHTLVLEDGNRIPAHSAPGFDAFRLVAASEMLGNRSFLFRRTEHSWHGVKPIACPPDRLRKVFIVVANRIDFQVLWRRLRGKDADGYPL